MDRRFWWNAAELFAERAGMPLHDFWLEPNPGTKTDSLGEDFAIAQGAQIFGWGAHGSACGGQPGLTDQEIRIRLDAKIAEKEAKYPDKKHFGLFMTEETIEIWEV
jgi:hypothetical protein